MTLHKTIRTIFLQDFVFASRWRFQISQPGAFLKTAIPSSASPKTDEIPEENPTKKRKVIKVAILGRPNAGKSTLINLILNKTVCDVSCKTHTTRKPLRAALTIGDTQLVFVDTPGIVTKQEFRRYDLSETFLEWKRNVFNQVDIVGVIHEAPRINQTHSFNMKLIHCLHELPETMPIFLIINKIDLVKDKEKLLKASKRLLNGKQSTKAAEDPEASASEDSTQDVEKNLQPGKPNMKERFSQIFYVSALKNIGVGDVVEYLLQQAKEGEWMLPEDKYCDTPLDNLILNLTRAEFMNSFSQALPYSLKFQIELLEENNLGQIACVVLVKCQRSSEKIYLLSRKLNKVKKIARKLESDLYNIFQKDFMITLVIADQKGKVRSVFENDTEETAS